MELYSTDYFLKEHENLSAGKLRDMIEEYVNEDNGKLGIIGMKMGLNKLMYWTPVSIYFIFELIDIFDSGFVN